MLAGVSTAVCVDSAVLRRGAALPCGGLRVPARVKMRNIVIVTLLLFVSGAVNALYHLWLAAPLAQLRAELNLDIWPHSWPLVVQLFFMFLLSEFLWYWIHRAEHRWNIIWRVSGHGAHHSFKTLSALNFGLNHPLELFFLLLPSILLELIFGIGAVAAGAALLLAVLLNRTHYPSQPRCECDTS